MQIWNMSSYFKNRISSQFFEANQAMKLWIISGYFVDLFGSKNF